MNENIRKLPVGIQSFEKLRKGENVYVDKTVYIHKLLRLDAPYFLSRPRRFGKSLFISTLKAYFEGRKDLFEGLAIAEMEQKWIQYPVFHIDLSRESFIDGVSLKSALNSNLKELESVWGKDESETTPAQRLDGLLRRAYEKSGREVAVLIDEYDKPLLDTMDKPKIHEDVREILRGFYGVLKSADQYLRFLFITGVTKFSHVSIFSGLNQLMDISLNEDYAGVCGITQTELEQYFEPEIISLAEKMESTRDETLAELRKRYNGYRFSDNAESVYNPFGILNTFAARAYRYYWFSTGTPAFLAIAMREQRFDICSLENDIEISSTEIMDYDMKKDDLPPLLYQTGYLTIKSYSRMLDTYTLGFPNEEVKYGFLNNLLPAFVSRGVTTGEFSVTMFMKRLMSNDIEGFMTSLRAFFAAIPYDAIKREHRDEQYYQHVFYLLFTMMGQFVYTEVKSAAGRADAVVKTADSCYVFEFKMDSNATAEDAIKQINDKGYLIPYTADSRRLIKIGVEFSQDERGVKRWIIE